MLGCHGPNLVVRESEKVDSWWVFLLFNTLTLSFVRCCWLGLKLSVLKIHGAFYLNLFFTKLSLYRRWGIDWHCKYWYRDSLLLGVILLIIHNCDFAWLLSLSSLFWWIICFRRWYFSSWKAYLKFFRFNRKHPLIADFSGSHSIKEVILLIGRYPSAEILASCDASTLRLHPLDRVQFG